MNQPAPYRVLARKYRPSNFAEMIGQDALVRTLTNAAAVDTAPFPSPDGLQVCFTSDRPGRPQIYVMNATGANLRRLVQADGWCDSPAWSPQGHLIAYTYSERGRNFDIHTVEPATGRTERLTYGEGDNENATWSPDGRLRHVPDRNPPGAALSPADRSGVFADRAMDPQDDR